MIRNPDCNRVDLDDEGDPEELDFEDDTNCYGIFSDEEEDDD